MKMHNLYYNSTLVLRIIEDMEKLSKNLKKIDTTNFTKKGMYLVESMNSFSNQLKNVYDIYNDIEDFINEYDRNMIGIDNH